MIRKILFYGGLITAIALFFAVADGKPIKPERVVQAAILIPVFAWGIWLRWDWAKKRRSQGRGSKEGPQ